MTGSQRPASEVAWHLDAMMRSAEIAGTTWSYIDTGSSERSILLLPGSLGTCEVFFKQIRALGQTYRIVAATYPALIEPEALADGLAELHNLLRLDGALIVGSSFAAYWLQFFALRHPGRVRKLILGNGFVDGELLRLSHPLFATSLVMDSSPEHLQDTWRKRVLMGPQSELRDLQIDMLSGRQAASVLQSRLRSVITAKPCPKPPLSDDHIVLLDCRDDPIVTPPMQVELESHYPLATRHCLTFGGHYPHILNSDAYDALLRLYAMN